MDLPTLTHKGWFGICPVYFGNPYGSAPLVVERHWCFLPLMMISEWIYGLSFFIISVFIPDYQPAWPLKITGELKR